MAEEKHYLFCHCFIYSLMGFVFGMLIVASLVFIKIN